MVYLFIFKLYIQLYMLLSQMQVNFEETFIIGLNWSTHFLNTLRTTRLLNQHKRFFYNKKPLLNDTVAVSKFASIKLSTILFLYR